MIAPKPPAKEEPMRAIIDALQSILSTIVEVVTLPFRVIGRLLSGLRPGGRT